MTNDSMPGELRLSDGLGPLPLWRDDAGRSWWGADELTGDHLLAWRDAAVAAERAGCIAACDALLLRSWTVDEARTNAPANATVRDCMQAIAMRGVSGPNDPLERPYSVRS